MGPKPHDLYRCHVTVLVCFCNPAAQVTSSISWEGDVNQLALDHGVRFNPGTSRDWMQSFWIFQWLPSFLLSLPSFLPRCWGVPEKPATFQSSFKERLFVLKFQRYQVSRVSMSMDATVLFAACPRKSVRPTSPTCSVATAATAATGNTLRMASCP